jgi:hypothetical protein
LEGWDDFDKSLDKLYNNSTNDRMEIHYTDHGEERLRERGINKREVREAMKKGARNPSKGGSSICKYRNEKGMLCVVYNVIGSSKVLIITAYRE